MYGFIHESIRQLLLRRYGDELWQEVLKRSGFESGKENIVNHHYPDSDTYLLVDSVSVLTKMPREQVWELYGRFLVEYIMEIGWDEFIRCMSPNLKGFLENLDSLHYFLDHVVYKAHLRGPSFRCEENADGSITLHYFTGRPGLYPIVKGVVCEVARVVFHIEISISVTGRIQRSVQMATGERIEEHVVFLIQVIDQGNGSKASSVASLIPIPTIENPDEMLRMTLPEFTAALPYHLVFDEHCRLIHSGNELVNHVPKELLEAGTPIVRAFELERPQIPFDFDSICNFINAVFVLQVKTLASNIKEPRKSTLSTAASNEVLNRDTEDDLLPNGHQLKLKGQMVLLADKKSLIYVCSPYVTCIAELVEYGMRLTAMPLHDATRFLILLNQQRLTDVELNLQLEENNEQLEMMAKDLEVEKRKTDSILKDMLPPMVADHIMNNKQVHACEFENTTVMFSDIPDFQSILVQCHPKDVVQLLNDLFHRFDRLVIMHKAYKVETVGDSYLTVGGIPEQIPEHAEIICHLAIGMLWEARSVVEPINKKPIEVRVGINSGPLVAGVVAIKLPRYCLFGDTVSMASSLELNGAVGKIQCSDKTYKYAMETGRFEFERRGRIHIKGKGDVETYFLLRSLKKSVWEIIGRERDVDKNTIDGYEELESRMFFAEKQGTIIRPVAVENSKTCCVS